MACCDGCDQIDFAHIILHFGLFGVVACRCAYLMQYHCTSQQVMENYFQLSIPHTHA
jgi:hypothetical protein